MSTGMLRRLTNRFIIIIIMRKELNDNYGDCVLVVYSLNSESWMVKNGRKSRLNLSGEIMLTSA